MMKELSTDDREELAALAQINAVMRGPSFMSRSKWRSLYQRLVRRGLVTWGKPPAGFDPKRFAGTEITAAGLAAIAEAVAR
jgi:hypothetical protein